MVYACHQCHKQFTSKKGLEYHLINQVCQGQESLASIDREKLQLLLSLRERELDICRLKFETAKLQANLTQVEPKETLIRDNIKEKPPKFIICLRIKPPSHPNNFGEECCDILWDLQIEPTVSFVGQKMLRSLHFHPSYPMNWNLQLGNDDYMSVFSDGHWKNIYTDLLITEFLRGNLHRLSKIYQNTDQLEDFVRDHLSEIQEQCRKTMKIESRKIFSGCARS